MVERRNGVTRQILERLVTANDDLPISDRKNHLLLLERANFLANIILGNSTKSVLQLFRGYQPSLVGIPPSMITPANIESNRPVVISRALSRMLRSNNFDAYQKPDLQIGQEVYGHVQRKPGSARDAVEWEKQVVVGLDDRMVKTRPVNRTSGRPHHVSYADLRVPPKDPLPQVAYEAALLQPLARLCRV